ncbi:MAG: alpha-amylase family glycosyl hydrolase, partial [Simkaniaceae bacterium]|nr:alpha-amylase family glycosyl hydrolase [Simkaniaceae bacterium]
MGGRIAGGVATFRVWAPAAKCVQVVGDFGEVALEKRGEFWEGECSASVGDLYHFLVDGKEKCDPYGLSGELRPGWRSRLVEMPKRAVWERKSSEAINIYEVHLGSWSCDGMVFRGYAEIARELAEYCGKLGYTHVEVMPVMAHQFDESWGYQVTGYFASSSRFGYPSDLQEFVKILHEAGIGVIFDWVPAHFPKNAHALAKFDGTPLFEYSDPKRGEHPEWETLVFDFGSEKVCEFLLNSALYWLEVMGGDGLRIDAVYSMLYHSYMRKDGEWLPNKDGGHE